MRVALERVKEVVVHLLKGLNATEEEASLVAESLTMAEMRGIDTHGLYYLKLLADRVEAGMLDLPTRLRVVKEAGTIALIDGGNGIGQLAAHRAMRISIEKALRFGTGCTLVRNTNHIGILAFYTRLAAEEGMVGIAMCNSAPSMAPWGGAEAFFGTNPMSIAVPGGLEEPPIILDMSSSVVARGKIRRAQRLKEGIPLGWALDEAGRPTTDPEAAMKGTLLPFGGPKGYGLAFMIDVLSGMLSGSQYGPRVRTFHQLMGPTGVGALLLAINIEKFMPLGEFRKLMHSYTASIRNSKRAKGVPRIFLPGEIELEKEKESLKQGIEVNPEVAAAIEALLEKVKSPLRLGEGVQGR